MLSQEIESKRRAPGEMIGAEAFAGDGVEVFAEASVINELERLAAQSVGLGRETIAFKAANDEPVHVNPNRTAPVSLRFKVLARGGYGWYSVRWLEAAVGRGKQVAQLAGAGGRGGAGKKRHEGSHGGLAEKPTRAVVAAVIEAGLGIP